VSHELVGPLAENEELICLLSGRARSGQTIGEFIELDGRRGYLKGSSLRGKAWLRHTLRRLFLGRRFPRLAEYENLLWLREHDFRAPLPLAAGVLRIRDRPPYQFLFTEEIENAFTLYAVLATAKEVERLSILSALGVEVARLHNLGFIHRDLYPRNLLYREKGEAVFFIDTWRGGARRQLRGPLYDHACLMLHGAAWWTTTEQAAYFRAYRSSISASTPALTQLSVHTWLRRIARERTRLTSRFIRNRPAISDLPLPGAWDISRLADDVVAKPIL